MYECVDTRRSPCDRRYIPLGKGARGGRDKIARRLGDLLRRRSTFPGYRFLFYFVIQRYIVDTSRRVFIVE